MSQAEVSLVHEELEDSGLDELVSEKVDQVLLVSDELEDSETLEALVTSEEAEDCALRDPRDCVVREETLLTLEAVETSETALRVLLELAVLTVLAVLQVTEDFEESVETDEGLESELAEEAVERSLRELAELGDREDEVETEDGEEAVAVLAVLASVSEERLWNEADEGLWVLRLLGELAVLAVLREDPVIELQVLLDDEVLGVLWELGVETDDDVEAVVSVETLWGVLGELAVERSDWLDGLEGLLGLDGELELFVEADEALAGLWELPLREVTVERLRKDCDEGELRLWGEEAVDRDLELTDPKETEDQVEIEDCDTRDWLEGLCGLSDVLEVLTSLRELTVLSERLLLELLLMVDADAIRSSCTC